MNLESGRNYNTNKDMESSRRDFLKKSSFLALAGLGAQFFSAGVVKAAVGLGQNKGIMASRFTLPELPYGYAALEPHIDKMTMEIHHSKHHMAYVNNLNDQVKVDNLSVSLEELVTNASKYSKIIRNNAGGHWNHSFFWKLMKPKGGGHPSGAIDKVFLKEFGEFYAFQQAFEAEALKRFGSGWVWLTMKKDGSFAIHSTPNQDNPLMDVSEIQGTPILALDVWEHAYYLHYENKRADYIKAWWNTINWDAVNENLTLARAKK